MILMFLIFFSSIYLKYFKKMVGTFNEYFVHNLLFYEKWEIPSTTEIDILEYCKIILELPILGGEFVEEEKFFEKLKKYLGIFSKTYL